MHLAGVVRTGTRQPWSARYETAEPEVCRRPNVRALGTMKGYSGAEPTAFAVWVQSMG